MFKLPEAEAAILKELRLEFAMRNFAPVKTDDGKKILESAAVMVIISDSLTKEVVLRHKRPGTGKPDEVRIVCDAIREAAGTDKPLTPSQLAAKNKELQAKINELEGRPAPAKSPRHDPGPQQQEDKFPPTRPAPKPKAPARPKRGDMEMQLIRDTKDRGLPILAGDPSTESWKDEVRLRLDDHDKEYAPKADAIREQYETHGLGLPNGNLLDPEVQALAQSTLDLLANQGNNESEERDVLKAMSSG
jgi:hypothetical protein